MPARLPESFDGFRLLHLTDLHIKQIGTLEKGVLEFARDLAPDLIVITGDFVDRWEDRDVCLEFVRQLEAPHGVWGVFGNWDHRTQRPVADFLNALERSGVSIIMNGRTAITRKGASLDLAGVDDPHTGHDDIREAVGARDGHRRRPCILMAHSPDIWDQVRGRNVDLVLAGHTHGGQICLPGGRPLWIPSKHGLKYASGSFRDEDSLMYVSRGIGFSTVQWRAFCPPESVLVTLRSGRHREEEAA